MTEEGKTVSLEELSSERHIINLVRRTHSAQECPHRGNCLNENEMRLELREYLRDLLAQARHQEREEAFKNGKKFQQELDKEAKWLKKKR